MAFDLTHVRFSGEERGARAPARRSRLPPRSLVPPTPSGDGAVLGPLVRRVLQHEGLDPDAYRPQPLQRRVAACLRALKASSEAEALRRLDAAPGAWETAAEALLIGVTALFRDPAVFDAIRQVVLPDLARRSRLRAWSAACSSGAELYSLAILLDEAGLLSRSELLGTDCRRQAVSAAAGGRLAREWLDGLDEGARRAYVEEWDGKPRLSRRLLERLRWRTGDVVASIEPGPWDLVLWRNSAMYLSAAVSGRIFRRIAGALAPGGYLVVGKAERPPDGLPLKAVARCVYLRGGS